MFPLRLWTGAKKMVASGGGWALGSPRVASGNWERMVGSIERQRTAGHAGRDVFSHSLEASFLDLREHEREGRKAAPPPPLFTSASHLCDPGKWERLSHGAVSTSKQREDRDRNMERRQIARSEVVRSESVLLRSCPVIVAIPARNESERIIRCLSALAVQRDGLGAPVPVGSFGVLLLVNNSCDETASAARRASSGLPYPLAVREVQLSRNATAGGARRLAMEEAAALIRCSSIEGFLLTTDADSVVSPTWLSSSVRHLEAGADCVAGYIDAEPAEIVSHGATFLSRGRLEDTYLRLVAEIYALCDPRDHDPWPNHRVSSGASLAVRLSAYDAVGGMPDKAVGEDGAFTALLDGRGYRVRHALDVTVLTSCRLDGRATGGAADTMRHRRDVPDAFCDDDLEPALQTLRRAAMRGFLRKAHRETGRKAALRRLLGNRSHFSQHGSFADDWKTVEALNPRLQRGDPLRPSDLPREIAKATLILKHLRAYRETKAARADRCLREAPFEPAVT